MAGEIQPLDSKFAIVGPDGRPTDYFTRWAQQKQIDIQSGISAEQAQELINTAITDWAAARQIIAGRALDGGGFLSSDVNIDHAESLVVPGTYGDATHVPQFVVDQEGHIQGVTAVPITGGGGGGGGSFAKLLDTTLAADVAANVTAFSLTSLSAAYDDLVFVLIPIVVGNSANNIISVRFNNDSGANYDWTLSSRFEGNTSYNQTSAQVAWLGYQTTLEGPLELEVFNYADVSKAEKHVRATNTGAGGGNYFRRNFDACWHPAVAAAINRIDFTYSSVLKAGSRLIMYGRGGSIGSGPKPWWFNPPAAASLTAISQDATLPTLTDDTDVGLIIDVNSGAAANRGAYKALTNKALDWDLKVRLDYWFENINYNSAGLIGIDSVSGKALSLTLTNNDGLALSKWNSFGSWNSDIIGGRTLNGGVALNWFRIVHTGGNYIFYVSGNGKQWIQYGSIADTAWTPNQIDRVCITGARGGNSGMSLSASYWSLTGPGA